MALDVADDPLNDLLARYVRSNNQFGPGNSAIDVSEADLRCSAKDFFDPPSEDDAPDMQSSRS